MVFATSFFLYAALSILTSGAAAAPSTVDWKYSLGWDGVTSSPTNIGSPVDGNADRLKARAASTVGGVYLCADADWEGTCGYAVQPLNECIVLGTDWNNLISSIGPDSDTLLKAYDAANCAGTEITFVNPGTGDLVSLGWNDRISSFTVSAE